MTRDQDQSYTETIQNIQRMVVQSRMDYYNQLTHRQSITDELHRELATRVLQYADILRVFQTRVDDFPDVDAVKQRMGQMEAFEVEAPGDTRNTTVEQRPAVLSIDPADLIQMTNRLDEVASDLGFGADLDTDQPGGIR